MSNEKETAGAWVIHHGRKLALDANGSADFPAIDEAAKASTLLAKLGQSDEVEISLNEVKAIAVSSGLNPRHELTGLLQVLEAKKLVDVSESTVAVLGVTTRAALSHAADIYEAAEPSPQERASLTLAEIASEAPVRRAEIEERIGDIHQMADEEVDDFLNRAIEIGFVDHEGSSNDALLFNGNLFRRNSVEKATRVLSSLSISEQASLREIQERLGTAGCLSVETGETILGKPLFDKLVAAGLFDLNQVTNEHGNHVYLTSPAAFHKFVDPMVDDCFDLAKSLVAALVYGMNARPSSQGRIQILPALLSKLIRGYEVGPTTSIGEDYRVLEIARVVKIRADPTRSGRYFLRLIKREVGELALQVLTQGNAYESSLVELRSAPMSGYVGPEQSRVAVRRSQSQLSRTKTRDVLEAVRGGRAF